jgi:hypothetical protein
MANVDIELPALALLTALFVSFLPSLLIPR